MATDNDRSTLFTTRSTENAMTFFTVIGFLTLVVIFLYHFFQVRGTVVYGVHSGVRCCLGKSPSRLFVFDVVDYFQGRSRCHAYAFARVSRPTEK